MTQYDEANRAYNLARMLKRHTFFVPPPEVEYERVPPEDFEWPCDREYAHGPHVPDETHDVRGTPMRRECPGVQAHPATMAGTVYRRIT